MMTTQDSGVSRRARRLAGWRAYRRALRKEDGYVLALTALLILPLLAFTAYAVDLGAWQARGAQLQRAADAASLAAARYMPDETAARNAAVATMRRNGYVHGVDGITITYEVPSGSTNRYRVTATDTTAEQYFSGSFRDGVSIERRATAQRLKSIPFGSPRNYIGTNQALGSPWRENFALSVASYCTPKEQGDRIVSRADWSYSSSTDGSGGFQSCTPGSPSYVRSNSDYDADGYVYAVEMPETFSGSTTLRIDAQSLAACTSGGVTDAQTLGSDSAVNAQQTRVEVRRADSSDPHLGTLLWGPSNITSSTSSGSYCGNTNSTTLNGSGSTWRQLWSGSASAGDKFYVIVKSPNTQTTNAAGNNQYSLRARTTSTFSPCTGDPADTLYSSQCPNVYAVSHLGNFLNAASAGAEFYLASIPADYNNHEMEIYLWDPGEGGNWMEVRDPNGNRVSTTVQIACQNSSFASSCSGETAPPGGYGPFTTNQLDLGNNANFCSNRPDPHVSSCRKYNDRLVRLTVQLPADIQAAYGGRTWWKVYYRSASSSVTDRLTWSIAIKGDPIRLVPNE